MSEVKQVVIALSILVLLIAGLFWLIPNAPSTTTTYHDLGDRGTYMCIEDWGWRRVGYIKECFEFKRLK